MNLQSFLVDRDGKAVKRYSPIIKPEKSKKDVLALLSSIRRQLFAIECIFFIQNEYFFIIFRILCITSRFFQPDLNIFPSNP